MSTSKELHDPLKHLHMSAGSSGDETSSGVFALGLEKLWPESEIEILEDADYRYRITVEKEKVIPVIMQKMETVDYSNFKNECHNMEDYYRALGGVWYMMYEYQNRQEV